MASSSTLALIPSISTCAEAMSNAWQLRRKASRKREENPFPCKTCLRMRGTTILSTFRVSFLNEYYSPCEHGLPDRSHGRSGDTDSLENAIRELLPRLHASLGPTTSKRARPISSDQTGLALGPTSLHRHTGTTEVRSSASRVPAKVARKSCGRRHGPPYMGPATPNAPAVAK